MKKSTLIFSILLAVVLVWIIFAFDLFRLNREDGKQVATSTPRQDVSTMIHVFTPKPGAWIDSPYGVTGEARGYWYFEASFPVRLLNASGTVIATGIARADGDWMTEDFVPFTADLTFKKPVSGGLGTLVLQKDNPSDKRELDAEIRIPVSF